MSAKKDLLEATKELLWERGFEGMSPKAILEKSEAGQGSLYHHFKSKSDLAATALQEVSQEMRESFKAYFNAEKPPLERVRDYIKQPRQALKGCRLGRLTPERAITDESLRNPVQEYFAFILGEIEQALAQAQQEGTLSLRLSPKELAATLVATVQGGYVLARAFQDPEQMERAIRGALALLDEIERKQK